jgi:hypothetical protein
MRNSQKVGKCIVVVLGLVASIASADEASVVDKKGTEIKLTKVSTTSIAVTQDKSGAVLQVPLSTVSRITPSTDGKTLVFTTSENRELRGTTSDKLEGVWDLGTYSVALTDIKSVQFLRAPGSTSTPATMKQPEGFVAVCADISGTSQEVFGISFNLAYSVPSSMWIGRSVTIESNPRWFLPVEVGGLTFSIAFADIQTVRFSHSKVSAWQTDTTIEATTVQGKSVTGKLASYGESNRRLTGSTTFGDFSLSIDKVASVTFKHPKDKSPKSVNLTADMGYNGKLDSGYAITVETWGGKTYAFRNGCVFSLEDGYEWSNRGTSFNLTIGESKSTVAFDKIKRIAFSEQGKTAGSLTAMSGSTVAIVGIDGAANIGGELQDFGPAHLRTVEVKTITISK